MIKTEKEKLDAVGVLLPMPLSDSDEKMAVASALVHEVADDTGMSLDETLSVMKRAIEAVIAMEREEEEDDSKRSS